MKKKTTNVYANTKLALMPILSFYAFVKTSNKFNKFSVANVNFTWFSYSLSTIQLNTIRASQNKSHYILQIRNYICQNQTYFLLPNCKDCKDHECKRWEGECHNPWMFYQTMSYVTRHPQAKDNYCGTTTSWCSFACFTKQLQQAHDVQVYLGD